MAVGSNVCETPLRVATLQSRWPRRRASSGSAIRGGSGSRRHSSTKRIFRMKLNSTHNRAGWSSKVFVGHVAAGPPLQSVCALAKTTVRSRKGLPQTSIVTDGSGGRRPRGQSRPGLSRSTRARLRPVDDFDFARSAVETLETARTAGDRVRPNLTCRTSRTRPFVNRPRNLISREAFPSEERSKV